MKIQINVKGVSRRRAAIAQISRDYPDGGMTAEAFLGETVRQTLRDYDKRREEDALMRLFSPDSAGEAVEDMAVSGKVSYGALGDERRADPDKAVENALQCFDDGIVALFADGVRYTKREDELPLRDGSEVTFIRLTALAGRMW